MARERIACMVTTPAGALLMRALRRICPVCGIGRPFQGWFRMTPECPHCGHHYEREEGYWIAAMVVNMGVTEALFGIVLVAGIIASWPDVAWGSLLIIGAVMNVVIPTVFYPLSKTLWVAIDTFFRQHPLL
jgi:uncharacterized protein (DUF983 family)